MAVLAVPMIVLLAAGGFISWNAIQELRYAKAADSVITTLQAYTPVSSSLQAERMLSLNGGSAEDIAAARAATDAALAAVRPITADLDLSQFPQPVVDRFVEVQLAHNTMLPAVRTSVDIKSQRAQIENNYASIIEGQLSLMEQVANSLENRALAQYVTAYREIGTTADNLVVELIDGLQLLGTRAPAPASVRQYDTQTAATELARSRSHAAIDSLSVESLAMPTKDPSSNFTRMRLPLQQGNPDGFAQIDVAAYVGEIQQQLGSLGALNTDVLDEAHDIASAAADEAQTQALVTIGIVIAALVASLFFALLVARGIVVPLRRLTKAAADVREQLPRLVEQVAIPGEGPEITLAPIPVTSRDEVGQLAAAFNSVNSTTVQVAQEQAALRGSIAEMFVNVARRDQVLLNRQLSFIDSLERAEEDPSTLANLFRLDHLATRMRRNAESLLVLAGIDSGRRLRDAMPLSDVVRTASSEIEQYDRVELDLQVDPHMHGFNALGAAHMLAELLENATIFSEPETPVTVTTGVSGQFVVVRILDQGLGMSDAELEAANAKIISTSASDSLGNQRLGLFVVGRIAQRLGADVRLLKAAHGTGTETIVRFPATLFVMTETNLYGNGAPAALAAPRNDPGLPQIEAPVVEEVDLAALTDGQTSLGLPHRRRRDDGSDEPVGPVPVTELAQSTGLPTRSKKTFDEDNLVLPEAPDGHLAAEISASGSDWKPATVAPLKGGLPSRSRASTSAWAKPEEPAAAAAAAATPAPAPAARAGLFSGFRGRTETASTDTGENLVVPGLASEDQERAQLPAQSNAVRAPWMSSGAHAAPVEPMVVPQLADDDDSWEAQEAENREAQNAAALAAADEVTQTEAAPVQDDAPAWAPTPAWDTAHTEAPVAETPAWEPPAAAEAPAWDAPAAEAVAAEVPAWEAPVAEVPAWEAPAAETAAWEAPVAETPGWGAPVAEAPAWEDSTAAQTPVWDDSVAAETPAWDAPATETPAAEAPAWNTVDADDAPAWDAPAAETPTWEAPAAAASAWDQTVVDDEPAWEAPVVGQHSSAALTSRSAAPEAEAAAPEVEAPAAPVAPVRTFTSYSGYAGWGAPAADVPAPYQPSERTLDEARAWHTGAMPVVPEASAPVEAPAQPTDEPTPAADDSAWPAPAWEPPTWQSPEWAEQPAEAAVEPEPVVEPEPELAVVDGVAFRRVYLEPDAEDEPTAEVDTYVAPEPEPVAEEAPSWAAPVQEAAPAWPTFQAPHEQVEAPTQVFTPIEAAAAVEQEPAPQAPAYQEAPVAYAAPEAAPAPAWAPTAPAQAAPTAQAPFSEVVQSQPHTQSDDAKGRRKWGLFGRKKGDDGAPDTSGSVPVQNAPAPVSQVAPVRTSAWTADAAAPQSPTGADSSQSWMASTTWQAPAAPTPVAQAPASMEPVSAGSWAPPEWAARPGANAAPSSTVPKPALPPSVAPRVGTLDDEVAAMLALRSDIQEQALSELSQLSAYRPAATGGNAERLTRRVPTAVPATTVTEDEGKPVQRDADQLRSRLSSFQSGTSRGRRATEDPSGQNGVS
ncbi:ATP-binding protein [Cellulomonas xylanilytica]|nr:ATP-binding protein [Cellulomonas xylanilytica]